MFTDTCTVKVDTNALRGQDSDFVMLNNALCLRPIPDNRNTLTEILNQDESPTTYEHE
jgi:hypothetical protein